MTSPNFKYSVACASKERIDVLEMNKLVFASQDKDFKLYWSLTALRLIKIELYLTLSEMIKYA